MGKNLYIIDGHSHIYAAYFAPMRQKLASPSGEPTKATYIFTNAVLGLIKNTRPDMLVVAMDSKIPSFRTKIYPEYKAHRPPMPDDMPQQIIRIESILEALNIPMLRVGGYEADDLIGTLAKKAAEKGIDAYICSKDKDMLQLLDGHISVFDMKTGEVTDSKTMKAKTGVTPAQFIDVLALQGDTADNIPGVPDVGPKTALDWINKYGSINNLLKHQDEIGGKRGESLRNSVEQLMLSRELVTIDCDAPVAVDEKVFALTEPDTDRLSALFTELGFTRLMTQMGLTPTETTGEKSAESTHERNGIQSIDTVKHDYTLIETSSQLDNFVKQLKKQKIFAIDTETTATDPMRAELVGLSFAFEPHRAWYLAIKTPMGQKHLDIKEVRQKLAGILTDEKIKKIGQNIKYDMLILRNAEMPLAGVYFDTMVASYCLDPLRRSHSMDAMAEDFLNYKCVPLSALIGKGKNQLTFDMVDTQTAGEYAAEDADITLQLYRYFDKQLETEPQLRKLFETVEMPLVAVLAQMEYNGVSLDTHLLRKMSSELAESLEKIQEKVFEYSARPFNIDSPKQLAEVLFDELGLKSVRSGKSGRSTDAGVLEQLKNEHEIIPLILEYRTLSKLKNTYTDKLAAMINPRTNRLHASFNQTITATGRLSSSNPNLQNIPIRTELGKKIRAAFIGQDASKSILSADYSQIELRLLAHLSKDKALLSAFAEDRDIHRFVASQIYDVPISEVTDEMRSHCKAVNFGIIYGQGAFGLAQSTGMTQTKARKFIDDYFKRYAAIRQYMDDCLKKARQSGYAETILGRRRKIPNLNSKNANKRNQAERFVINTTIQGSAADLIKVAMIRIQQKIDAKNLPVKLILQIHDELVFEMPKSQTAEHQKWITHEMTTAIKLDAPLKVDIAIGPNWLGSE